MDYVGVLKRAWHVTWRYRILWLFGLFAGGVGGGGGGGNNAVYSGNLSDRDIEWLTPRELDRIGYWVQDNIALIVALAAFLAVIGLGMFILSLAAKAGLVFLVNEAEEQRPVRGMEGWTAGFRAWFRVLGIMIVLFVPLFVFAAAITIAALAPMLGPLFVGGQPRAEAVVGMCGGVLLGGLVLVLLGILVALLDTLAVRHAVLDGSGVFASIGAAWTDVRTRFKDVFLMWLIMVAVGIAFGIGVGVIAAMFAFGIVAAVFMESYVAAAVIGFVLFLVLLLPSAIFGAFSSAVWTIFFRRLTGREIVEPRSVTGYAPPLDAGAPAAPTAPPAAPPPAPPTAPPAAPSPPPDSVERPEPPAPPRAPEAPAPPAPGPPVVQPPPDPEPEDDEE